MGNTSLSIYFLICCLLLDRISQVECCSQKCLHNECIGDTNDCADGCNPGYYGTDCSIVCSPRCLGHQCGVENGKCTSGCQTGYYGEMCNTACNDRCKPRTCRQNDGFCDKGCQDGYYGSMCNKSCDCETLECKQETGSCMMDTSTDSYSSATSAGTSTVLAESADSPNEKTATIIGGVIGSIVVVSILIVGMVLFYRYYKQRNNQPVICQETQSAPDAY